jgi:hypothetical protein
VLAGTGSFATADDRPGGQYRPARRAKRRRARSHAITNVYPLNFPARLLQFRRNRLCRFGSERHDAHPRTAVNTPASGWPQGFPSPCQMGVRDIVLVGHAALDASLWARVNAFSGGFRWVTNVPLGCADWGFLDPVILAPFVVKSGYGATGFTLLSRRSGERQKM